MEMMKANNVILKVKKWQIFWNIKVGSYLVYAFFRLEAHRQFSVKVMKEQSVKYAF